VLLAHPDELDLLRARPELARSTAVEELLQFCSPVACGAVRRLTAEIELHGVVLPAGSKLLGVLISANRDEAHFADPDVLDLTRDPNPHLAFTVGPHFCLGNRLARLEGNLVFEAIAERFTDIRLAPGADIAYKPTQSLRGLRSLPVVLRPA
jgi:cytochrome P450